MFEKITFEKKLGIDSSERKYIGMKVGVISILVMLFGNLIAFLGFIRIGDGITVIGIVGGAVALVLHFLGMYTNIFKEKK